MNKIIIEDNIPLPKGTNKSKLDPRTLSLIKYREDCIENMKNMKVGQSFLIYDKQESTIWGWIRKIKNKNFKFILEPDKSKKAIRKYIHTWKADANHYYHNSFVPFRHYEGKEVKQYPIRVWRIK